jgi:hypothetical protein
MKLHNPTSEMRLRHKPNNFEKFLATDPEVRVLFPALPDFLISNGSGMGSTQRVQLRIYLKKK